MDSLRVLRDSLDSSRPPGGASKRHEKRLNTEFKAAALHLTNLYRNSLVSAQSSHRLGYVQGLRDILDLILLRSSQAATGGPHTFEHVDLPSEDEGAASLGAASMPSHKELRWLVRYLQARIDAIKSESDEDDVDVDMDRQSEADPASYSNRNHQQKAPTSSVASTSSLAAHQSNHASSSSASDSRRSEVPLTGREEMRDASPGSSVPNTPAQRPHRHSSAQMASYDGEEATPCRRSSASSSAFSFSFPPSGSGQHGEASGSSPALRRKARGAPSPQPLAINSQHVRTLGNSVSAPPPLSPVGEEAVGRSGAMQGNADDDMPLDGEAREYRGNGRRGPMPRTDGERVKRRKKGGRPSSARDDGADEESTADGAGDSTSVV
ncbi:unnamed protein product [Parajaminaea phylloscopi]